jgi:hypothetical protein
VLGALKSYWLHFVVIAMSPENLAARRCPSGTKFGLKLKCRRICLTATIFYHVVSKITLEADVA